MTGFAENRHIATVALVVDSYDEAIDWYVERMGFVLLENVDLGGGKRWVTVAPASGRGARLLLAEASDEAQRKSIGNQTGGRVFSSWKPTTLPAIMRRWWRRASNFASHRAWSPTARWRFSPISTAIYGT